MYKIRRTKLLESIRAQYPDVKKGVVLLFASLENDKHEFRQESSFYYLTGITEPGVVLCMYLDGAETLFIPNYGQRRDQWVNVFGCDTQNCGVDAVEMLGKPCVGYTLSPYFKRETYKTLIDGLKNYLSKDAALFGLCNTAWADYFVAWYRLKNIVTCLNVGQNAIHDISEIVQDMRLVKDVEEIDCMRRASEITRQAQERVAQMIKPGVYEYEIQAEIERCFTQNQARCAFPSIVATGKNTTVLHYLTRDQKITEGDLVVVDIGAEYEHYCADVTRTYAASGTMTERQQELYEAVESVKRDVAFSAKPGMFLVNNDDPKKSLHHIALGLLREKGNFDQYLVHGIGHFLGLNVHDVGISTYPLETGNVITLEPGIYIPDENNGIRLEDDYLVTQTGVTIL